MMNEGHCLAQQIDQWCDRHGVRASNEPSAFQLSTLLTLMAAGEGVSLVPFMAVADEQAANCVFVKSRTAILFRELNLNGNPARFWSKATAEVSDVARAVVLDRLSGLPSSGTQGPLTSAEFYSGLLAPVDQRDASATDRRLIIG